MTRPHRSWESPFQIGPGRKLGTHVPWGIHATSEHRPLVDFPEPREEAGEAIFINTNVTLEQLPAIIATRLEQALQVRRLEAQIAEVSERIGQLEAAPIKAREATIQTLVPEPYELIRPIRVSLGEDSSGGYVASFFDANIEASGETEQEAFGNLKNLLLDVYDSLANEKPERLGPEPERQFAVLRSFIRGT